MAALQEHESRRIGAELHDQIGQDMTAIATRLRIVELTASNPTVLEGLSSISSLVTTAHGHLREVINELHPAVLDRFGLTRRSEEHTSELQSLMRISYAVFCLKKKTKYIRNHTTIYFTCPRYINI